MKKYLLMFAFLLCGVLAFTSCTKDGEPGDDSTQTEWKQGLDLSQDGKIILRVNDAGAGGKVTYVADFDDNGKCVKYVITIEIEGQEPITTDCTGDMAGLDYDLIKEILQQMLPTDI